MEWLTIDNLVTLALLTMLQAVLGFDNLLYITLESNRAPVERRKMVRTLGISLAVILRIVLLFLILSLIELFKTPMFSIHLEGIVEGEFNLHSVIVLLGGVFIMYTAVKEIWHMMGVTDLEHDERKASSVTKIIISIVIMNAVFSFDSILSAIALTKVFWVMATAIIIGGILMIWLSDSVSRFLEKNRMYEVLGLFILLIVGVMLLTEGGHLAHLHIAGAPIVPMTKVTFYFVIGVLVLSDIVQSRYHKRLLAEQRVLKKAKQEA